MGELRRRSEINHFRYVYLFDSGVIYMGRKERFSVYDILLNPTNGYTIWGRMRDKNMI